MIGPIIAVAFFSGMLLSIEAGYRIGRHVEHTSNSIEVIGTVDAAVFGLLGLILAFTFSGASDRLTTRRAQIIQEANAIGTAYLRVDVLAPSAQSPVRRLFREYLQARIDAFDNFTQPHTFAAALAHSEEVQHEIWTLSMQSCRADAKPDACLLLLPALNEMIDITTTRTMAAHTHAPRIILVLLMLLAIVAALLSGFAMSSQIRRRPLHMLLFSVAISISLYVVFDLEYPREGLITLKAADA